MSRYMAYGFTGKDYFVDLDDEAVPERQISMTYEDCAEVIPPDDLGGPGDWMPGHE
jgi:hypothetical protein